MRKETSFILHINFTFYVLPEVERKSVDEEEKLADLPDTESESSRNIEPRSQSSQQCT